MISPVLLTLTPMLRWVEPARLVAWQLYWPASTVEVLSIVRLERFLGRGSRSVKGGYQTI